MTIGPIPPFGVRDAAAPRIESFRVPDQMVGGIPSTGKSTVSGVEG
ncbi:MAG TPA: hypothetical protein VF444_23785 [Pseudonocardiaceae bacterium]